MDQEQEERDTPLDAPTTSRSPAMSAAAVEREHLFDKVVTPSDVGKLNRLVVPKQFAERYFPLDPAAGGGRGTELRFEDRGGLAWHFRYSYWGSSQSYVMTKGWSRFVRAARLAAGDTVSFSRGVGPRGRGRLFIDYRRRCHRLALPPAAPRLPWGALIAGRGSRIDFGAVAPPPGPLLPAPGAGRPPELRTLRLFGVDLELGDGGGGGGGSRGDGRPEGQLMDMEEERR